jgi:ankyrin repeat protein
MYIYLIDNKVYLTIPIIAGSDIAIDNTCKTFNVLKKYRDNVQTELDFFDNLFELLGDRYTSQRTQIKQYKNIVESLHQQGAFNGLQADDFNSDVLKEFLDQSNSMVLDPQTNRDDFLKSSNPTFSLQHKRFGQEEVSESILGIQLREAITNIERIKLDTPSIDNFKEDLPDIDINDEAPLERCKEAWLQAGFTGEQWPHAEGALAERIKLMLEIKDEETISFDKDQLCGALDSVWAIIAQNKVSFNSLANDIFTSTETNEVKIDKIAVLIQFFLGNINIYLKDIDRETPNLGEIFDGNEDLSSSLANAVQESLTRGDNAADTIINFLEINGLCPELSKEQKEEAKKLFINRYITIKGSDHFDEFFVLPKDTNSPWFYYGGAFSLEITKFASKFQVTKDQFKDFIESVNFNEVTREADNALSNVDFIDYFDLDDMEIILDQNNINALEILGNIKYKPTGYIYDKIISRIDIEKIDNTTAQGLLNIAISKNNTDLLKTAADKGANLDIQDENGRTPLHLTIDRKTPEIAYILIEKGANLDTQDIYGKTPLHWAIIYNRTEIALALINKGANLDIKDKYGQSPLLWAIYENNTEIALVLALINKGANLDIKDKSGQSPLHWAIYENNTEIALALINKGANLDIKEDKGGLTPLQWAIYMNHPEIALTLINKGANLDLKDKDGNTPLHSATSKNNPEIALALINKGANLDIQDKYGQTPLHWAIYKNNPEIALALINKGANLNMQDEDRSKIPIHLAIEKGLTEITLALIEKGANLDIQNENGKTPLQWAIEKRCTNIAIALIDRGANLDIQDKYGRTPLHWAIHYHSSEIALAIINKGANLDTKDKNGKTPLHLNIQEGLTEISLALIENGANVDFKNNFGNTPLHWAIVNDKDEIALALIENGADLDVKDEYGKTPLNLAIEKGLTEITLALIEKGANLDIQNENGKTPLQWAIEKRYTNIAIALIENGANLDIQEQRRPNSSSLGYNL